MQKWAYLRHHYHRKFCLTCLDPTLQISSVQACDNPSTDANDSVHDVPSEASLDIVQCAVCEMPCFDFMKCFVCNKFVHEFCSKSEASNAICQLCSNEKDISTERSQAAESLKRQATRMRNRPEKFLTEVEIEHNVLIPLPNVDRGKGDPRNVMAVVTERVHNGYKLGTSGGMLLGSYTRNQFELSDSQFLGKETVDNTSEISLRVCGGQGFTKCENSASGKLRCNTKRCVCKKAAVLCNSRCHPNIACNNK
jgi:hypothetical protein